MACCCGQDESGRQKHKPRTPEQVKSLVTRLNRIDGQILGKPKSEADAIRMLNLLSGRRHEVMTGLTVLSGGQSQTRVVRTGIEFRRLTDREIDAYVATGEPMDKAGAYGIQGRASIFVSHLDGDYFCVMGLPVCTLTQMLRERGVTVLG